MNSEEYREKRREIQERYENELDALEREYLQSREREKRDLSFLRQQPSEPTKTERAHLAIDSMEGEFTIADVAVRQRAMFPEAEHAKHNTIGRVLSQMEAERRVLVVQRSSANNRRAGVWRLFRADEVEAR